MSAGNAVKLGVATLLLWGATAQAQGPSRYTFTTVVDSQRDGLVATRCAAINSFGTVAVQVRDDTQGINMMITKQGADDAPVVVADTRAVADFPGFCDNGITSMPSDPSINELGEVAFQGNLRRLTTRLECGTTEQRRRRQGVYLGGAAGLATIAHTINPPGGDFISEFLVADQSANSFGQVAIVPELDNFDSGLFTGSREGTFTTRFLDSQGLFDTPSSRVSMNELGQIAFEDSGIVISNPDGTFTPIPTPGMGVGSPSLNLFGRVAFEGSSFEGNTQVRGIFTSGGDQVTTVADSRGRYDSFREPSLNDLGQVAFTADLDELLDGRNIQGVFTGNNPTRDVVLQAGDLYEGVPITSIVSCNEALNNFGQIVMTVQSENPATFEVRTFVVKATPQ